MSDVVLGIPESDPRVLPVRRSPDGRSPLCPRCGEVMVSASNRRGNTLYECENPDCILMKGNWMKRQGLLINIAYAAVPINHEE